MSEGSCTGGITRSTGTVAGQFNVFLILPTTTRQRT